MSNALSSETRPPPKARAQPADVVAAVLGATIARRPEPMHPNARLKSRQLCNIMTVSAHRPCLTTKPRRPLSPADPGRHRVTRRLPWRFWLKVKVS